MYIEKIDIKVIRNKKNYGAFINKYENIRKCSNDFVYQLDSDNASGPEIDNIFYEISEEDESKNLYIYRQKYISFIIFQKLQSMQVN